MCVTVVTQKQKSEDIDRHSSKVQVVLVEVERYLHVVKLGKGRVKYVAVHMTNVGPTLRSLLWDLSQSWM